MVDENKIVFTESGKCRFDLLVTELSEDIRAELIRRKQYSVQKTEISRSDVENISKSMRLTMLGLRNNRLPNSDLVIKMYLATGAVMLTAGIFLPQIRHWKDDPVQAMLVVTGILMTAASYLVKTNIERRKESGVLLSQAYPSLKPSDEHVTSKMSKS